MEEEDSRRLRRRRGMSARPKLRDVGGTGSHDEATGTTNIHDLTDDLLELVLLRIPSPVCLIHAAATCRLWRRLISGAGFARRFRSLHSLFVLGQYYAGARTAFVAKPSPPGETVVDVSGRVSLSFFPRHYDMRTMELTDCRGGLLAFFRFDFSVVVCDPLARQYREVDLPATPAPQRFSPCLSVFLLDADADAGDDTVTRLSMPNFRVLCVPVVCEDGDDGRSTARAFVFSARDTNWLLLNITVLQPKPCVYRFVGRMEGKLVWTLEGGKVLHLDESTGEISSFTLPVPGPPANNDDGYFNLYERWNLRAVGRDDTGAVRLVRIVGSDVEVLRCVPGNGGVAAVMVERTTNLSQLGSMEAWLRPPSWRFLEVEEGVPAGRVVLSPGEKHTWMFSLNVETMELEPWLKRNCLARHAFPFELPWSWIKVDAVDKRYKRTEGNVIFPP